VKVNFSKETFPTPIRIKPVFLPNLFILKNKGDVKKVWFFYFPFHRDIENMYVPIEK
jgi:hypothetical protein